MVKIMLRTQGQAVFEEMFLEERMTCYHYLSDWNVSVGCFPPEKLPSSEFHEAFCNGGVQT